MRIGQEVTRYYEMKPASLYIVVGASSRPKALLPRGSGSPPGTGETKDRGGTENPQVMVRASWGCFKIVNSLTEQ